MIRTSTDNDVLDKVPANIEMCFHTIANTGQTLQYEWRRDTYAGTEFQHKVNRVGGTKEKKEANKPSEATKRDDTKHVQKQKAKP